MKIFLDDERETPEGWMRVYWPDEAVKMLQTGLVEEISLDHDLGNDNRGTGYDVITWIEKAVVTENFVPPKKITAHTSNPSAKQKMTQGINSIYKHYYKKKNFRGY